MCVECARRRRADFSGKTGNLKMRRCVFFFRCGLFSWFPVLASSLASCVALMIIKLVLVPVNVRVFACARVNEREDE